MERELFSRNACECFFRLAWTPGASSFTVNVYQVFPAKIGLRELAELEKNPLVKVFKLPGTHIWHYYNIKPTVVIDRANVVHACRDMYTFLVGCENGVLWCVHHEVNRFELQQGENLVSFQNYYDLGHVSFPWFVTTEYVYAFKSHAKIPVRIWAAMCDDLFGCGFHLDIVPYRFLGGYIQYSKDEEICNMRKSYQPLKDFLSSFHHYFPIYNIFE